MTQADKLRAHAAQLNAEAYALETGKFTAEPRDVCDQQYGVNSGQDQCLKADAKPTRLDFLFTYHPPTPEQLPRYQAIRTAARRFAEDVLANTPPGRDQDNAIELIRATVWTANSAIALDGRS